MNTEIINRHTLFVLCLLLISSSMSAQTSKDSDLPYQQIPDYPENYGAETVVKRLLDGLGFRFYWATEGLKEADLSYKPSPEGRSLQETLDHILGLSEVIRQSARKEKVIRGERPAAGLNWQAKRALVLQNIQVASRLFETTESLDIHPMIFSYPKGERSYPFWNMINGPISDALWHCGQIVLLRRAAGNPMPIGVNVLEGIRKGS
ncbi:DinB family protein [Robiginitalea sp. IMCC43444]|uniref:DinB family protein n=1 Tax=Robiginitalea sp. IMCC43444 TaxID=3459121 RepID=UPI00404247F4